MELFVNLRQLFSLELKLIQIKMRICCVQNLSETPDLLAVRQRQEELCNFQEVLAKIK